MSMIRTAVKRPVAVWMLMLAIMLFGMVSLTRLTIQLLPDLSYPTLTIRTLYDGAAPVEVEQLISKPIEESVGIVKNLKQVRSISRSGMSDVILEFEWGTNMDIASLDVREKLDSISLPLDINKPLLLRFNPNLDPIIRLALSAQGQTEAELKALRTYAQEDLKRQLEAINGVAAVRLSGGLEQEVHILLDQQKLAQLNLTAEQLRERIRSENINLSAGKVTQGDKEYLVRTLNQFADIEQLANVIVYRDQQRLIRLGDVAEVMDAHKERSDITRIADKESIELAIYKEGDANTVEVAQRIKALTSQWDQPNKPLTLIYDQSQFIESAVSEVTSAAFIGSLLAMLVIYLFLRDILATLIISVSIPFSVIATFNMMYFSHISLNIMSLGGIALAVGLLVDNAIVVLENIDRNRQLGLSRIEAAIQGTQEVSGAIVASTLTTLAVFVPLIFVDGIAGSLFSDQATTVTFALLASLMVALTAIPMLASREGFSALPALVSSEAKPTPEGKLAKLTHYSATLFMLPINILFRWLPHFLLTLVLTITRIVSWTVGLIMRPLAAGFNYVYAGLERLYHGLLSMALRQSILTLFVALCVPLSALLLFPRLGIELIPPMNQGLVYVDTLLPPGYDVQQTDKVLNQLGQSVSDQPSVSHVFSQAGTGGLMTSDTRRGGENWGRLQISLKDAASYDAISAILRQQASMIPELEVQIQPPELFSFDSPLQIELIGYDLNQLKHTSAQLVNRLASSARFTDLSSSLKDGQPELSIRFDHARLAQLGMTAPQVAETIASRIGGRVASQLTVNDRKVDILIRSELEQRDNISDIEQMIINPDSAQSLPLSAVAEVSLATGPSAINRINQQRVAMITANLAYGDLGEAVQEAGSLLSQANVPSSLQIRFGGQNEEMQQSFLSLKIAIALAICLVYLVMASQFESLLHPLLILFAIPLAIAGSVLGLFISGTHLSVVVFIGFIMLTGIVVNNAIVLIDKINQLRQAGERKIAAIELAAHSRLRPILMTTLTTSLGLLPMALGFGEGSEVRAPMAITVISGLLFSTLLTLVVIPVLYQLFDIKHYQNVEEHA
ncbi:efflux RND transporter permease subunit [Shewanella sp. NIFS-20-20]|uniref:efflux RND transporter permease subunit n=1 Tax=Shewanella sp. NIFS-20-20 TaxID=2853806 RepID=UPI001C48E6D0|nr:efflux RND transporter permease subunit [Shewanella sp. NIFS-20-20]MBV7315510.1 efflux RND transporter permease subunit [Shewanella sp. NIFS-20-20]